MTHSLGGGGGRGRQSRRDQLGLENNKKIFWISLTTCIIASSDLQLISQIIILLAAMPLSPMGLKKRLKQS